MCVFNLISEYKYGVCTYEEKKYQNFAPHRDKMKLKAWKCAHQILKHIQDLDICDPNIGSNAVFHPLKAAKCLPELNLAIFAYILWRILLPLPLKMYKSRESYFYFKSTWSITLPVLCLWIHFLEKSLFLHRIMDKSSLYFLKKKNLDLCCCLADERVKDTNFFMVKAEGHCSLGQWEKAEIVSFVPVAITQIFITWLLRLLFIFPFISLLCAHLLCVRLNVHKKMDDSSTANQIYIRV